MVTTSQILAERAMQLPCDEQCVDWAIELLASGHETEATCRLAAKLRPHNHFELATLRDQILVELDAADTTFDSAVCTYVAEMLAGSNTETLDTVLKEIKNIYVSNDHEPTGIYDFYLLYFARLDLTEHKTQHYWPDADFDNIDQITTDRIREFVALHGANA
jgi:hypothetical protein